jgi:hypothetical protein
LLRLTVTRAVQLPYCSRNGAISENSSLVLVSTSAASVRIMSSVY